MASKRFSAKEQASFRAGIVYANSQKRKSVRKTSRSSRRTRRG